MHSPGSYLSASCHAGVGWARDQAATALQGSGDKQDGSAEQQAATATLERTSSPDEEAQVRCLTLLCATFLVVSARQAVP